MVMIGLLSYSVLSASQTSDNWGKNIDCLTTDLIAVENVVSAYLKLSHWRSLSGIF